MSLTETLTWPFFEAHHRRFAEELARWADATLPGLPHDDVDAACRAYGMPITHGYTLVEFIAIAETGIDAKPDLPFSPVVEILAVGVQLRADGEALAIDAIA